MTESAGISFVAPIVCLLHLIALVASIPCYHGNATSVCVVVETPVCMTAEVTFNYTSQVFTNSTYNQSVIQEQLKYWEHLRLVPECWKLIQPFLCSVYLPKCENDKQEVERPNKELCERVKTPCEVVKRYNGKWPWFLDCDQWFYAESCGQTFYETTTFDTEGECSGPLTKTDNEAIWYDKIKGCGQQCESALYTTSEHLVTYILIAIMAAVCLLCSIFTLLTFVLNWKVGRKYPEVILFYINGCFCLATIGWLVRYIVGKDVVCRMDGTVRKGEPLIGSGETASCTIVFLFVYYFTMAAATWYVMLAISWDIKFKALGTARNDLTKKTAYFHIISWCLPLVLTIICLSTSVIDADSLSGVCYPGSNNVWVRFGYVLVPILIALIVGAVYSIRGLKTLIEFKKESPPFVGQKATSKIHDTIIRLGIFVALTFILVVLTLSVHVYKFVNTQTWDDSLLQYTYCKANVSVIQIMDGAAESSCVMKTKPSIVAAIFNFGAFFGASMLFSSWSWTRTSVDVWRRAFRRLCNKPVNEPQTTRKHRIVARRSKRQKQRQNERLSINYGTDPNDPVGLRFDRSSASSHSMSSGYTVSIPKHGRRTRDVKNMHHHRSRRATSDSDGMSQGSRKGSSKASHRRSYESSMSQKLSDIEREIREEERRKRRKRKGDRRKKFNSRVQPIFEPISNNVLKMNSYQMKNFMNRRRRKSDSSDISMGSGLNGFPFGPNKNHQDVQSNGHMQSNISESNSISEIELPQAQPKLPDFSIFTAKCELPSSENMKTDTNIKSNYEQVKGDNSTSNTANFKGANPSPSGSFRRGRRREVKLEMTETSFYQEDEDKIEMGGNQVIHAEENCQETGEVTNLQELGPLVNEIFAQARASAGAGRNSGQKDVMGSSRLGSASSRGSKGSQGNARDFKYANTKVNLPPEVPRNDTEKASRKRPFSGDYVLTAKRNTAKREHETRKSQSQPNSRVSSATSNHKRQIGHNGKMNFYDGQSWSRFLNNKGYCAGDFFGPIGNQPDVVTNYHSNSFFSSPANYFQLNPIDFYPAHQGPFPGQLQLTEKGHAISNGHSESISGCGASTGFNLADKSTFGDKPQYSPRPYTNPYRNLEHQAAAMDKESNLQATIDLPEVTNAGKQYVGKRPNIKEKRKYQDLAEGDVLGNEPDVPFAITSGNSSSADQCYIPRPYTNPYRKQGDPTLHEDVSKIPGVERTDNKDINRTTEVNVLNIEQEQKEEMLNQRPYTNPYRKHRGPSLENSDIFDNPERIEVTAEVHRWSAMNDETVDILNVEAEHCMHCGADKNRPENVDILDIAAEQMALSADTKKCVQNDLACVGCKTKCAENNKGSKFTSGNNFVIESTVKENQNVVEGLDDKKALKNKRDRIDKQSLDYASEKQEKLHENHAKVGNKKDTKQKISETSSPRPKTPKSKLPNAEEVNNVSDNCEIIKASSPSKGLCESPNKTYISPRTKGLETERNAFNVAKVNALKKEAKEKVSAFDGSGSKGKQILTNHAFKDAISNGALVLTKGHKGTGLFTFNKSKLDNLPVASKSKQKPPIKEDNLKGKVKQIAQDNDVKMNGDTQPVNPRSDQVIQGANGATRETKAKGILTGPINPPLKTFPESDQRDKAMHVPISEEGQERKNVLLPPRRRLGSQGSGSTSSRSTSAITRSSGTSRNDNSDSFTTQNSGNLKLGLNNENFKPPPKEKNAAKSKPPPERSVGMFDFLECDDFDSEYDDVSTDNLTDTYTCTDNDDDLTEVSSLPC
ncbi:uncharacterized protein LOC127848283 [Dreissena polymorpha]|uniref:Smoothened n=1 Tax=Dreissena polymorpha TaxID=45954 RepID=A0A9D4I6P1_DREPO|nr:uncharacterized protein LOC127848283 [Dreissena polymorpha]KAH3748542.1 hypothetical protein DPMN_182988 [Dreissena polymorpha]